MTGGRSGQLAAAVGAVLLFTAIGYTAGTRVQSRAEAAARARPPAPAVITAEVELQQLEATVTLDCEVGWAYEQHVSALPPYEGSVAVVTRTYVNAGDQVQPGAVLMELAGRPVMLLSGEFPAYRDLTHGLVGPDVEQLQRALADLGFHSKDTPGRFGSSTQAAIARMYESHGYRARRATNQDTPPAEGQAAPPVAPQVILPRNEVVFAPKGSMRVGETSLLGAQPTDLMLTLLGGGQDLECRPLSSMAGVAVGQLARVIGRPDAVGQVSATERIIPPVEGGASPLDSQSDQPESLGPEIALSSELDPPVSAGARVSVEVVTASSGAAVMTVPIAAIGGTDQHPVTTVYEGSGRRRTVEVRVIIVADGLIGVEPVQPGDIEFGDDVIIAG